MNQEIENQETTTLLLSTTATTRSPRADDKKAYAVRALTRKTCSYQKRQIWTNLCCVVYRDIDLFLDTRLQFDVYRFCPFMMVAVAGMLAGVVDLLRTNLINSTGGPVLSQIKYCSDKMQVDNRFSPLIIQNASFLRESNRRDTVFDVNYFQLTFPELFENKGMQQNGFLWKSVLYPCVQWMEPEYPSTEPYAAPGSTGKKLDTTFMPDPWGGWFNESYKPISPLYNQLGEIPEQSRRPYFQNLNQRQGLPWNYIHARAGLDLGKKGMPDMISRPEDAPTGEGFLSYTPTGLYKIATNPATYLPADFFVPIEGNPDDWMFDAVYNLTHLYQMVWIKDDRRWEDIFNFLALSNLTNRYPFYGAIYVDEMDKVRKQMAMTLQAGTVDRVRVGAFYSNLVLFFLDYGRIVDVNTMIPPVGFRLIYQLTRMTNALLASEPSESLTKINHGFRAFPHTVTWDVGQLPVDFRSIVGKNTFPYGLSFLLPIFVLTLVKEKEDRILIMMRMHGLSTFSYYLSHYIHFSILQLICSAIFVASGFIFNMSFFTMTDPGVYILLLLLWTHVMVGISFLLSLFFSRSRFALISTFAVILFSAMINQFEDIIFNFEQPPTIWYIWPFWAFYHAINVLCDTSGIPDRMPPYQLRDLVPGDPVFACFMFLMACGILLYLLVAYLVVVLPSEYGVAKSWHFVFTDLTRWIRTKIYKDSAYSSIIQKDIDGHDEDTDSLDLPEEDADVRAERQRVLNIDSSSIEAAHYPLLIKNIRKQYASGKIAVQSLCLGVEENIVFGLLGPNGAGKSSLIHMMTGLHSPTSGTALVSGFDIQTDMKEVYLNIGVCPQHDILWDDLTVEEHLLFYARLRGISPKNEELVVKKAISEVQLTPFTHRLSRGLSGGEKRRLSIAIALLGDVPLVFLDEPSTGLDPEVRRTIWNIIQSAKKGRTIVLTTHSMDEADILSSRIGIMSKGTLRCLGTPLELKQKYGSGFKLTISFKKDASITAKIRNDACREIEKLLPSDFKRLNQGGVQGTINYEFNDISGSGTISRILDSMEPLKDSYGIEDWALSQSSLEEVFLNIVSDGDADAE